MQFKQRGSELRRRRGKKVVKRITAESVCWVDGTAIKKTLIGTHEKFQKDVNAEDTVNVLSKCFRHGRVSASYHQIIIR